MEAVPNEQTNPFPTLEEPTTENCASSLEDILSQKDAQINELQDTISHIASQYEALREIAEQYKEEAAKWHYLFLNKNKP